MLERTLDELLVVCERAYAEEKSGTRERSILSTTMKNLRRCLQESTTERAVRKDSSAATSTTSTPSKMVSTTNREGGGAAAEPGTTSSEISTTQPERNMNGPLPAGEEWSPRRRLLTSSDALNRLAYAGRVSLVGDKLAPSEKTSTGGSIYRGSTKSLIASLELAAVLLNSGIVPTQLSMPAPFFDVSQSASGGAQAFFSKILGGGGKGNKEPASTATGTTRELTNPSATVSPGQGGVVAVAENVRDALVDAVLAAAPLTLGKDATDKLMFVFITTLQAAAVPRVSRTATDEVGDKVTELRFSTLSLHGPRLVRVMHLLYAYLTRPNTSFVLTDEVKSALQLIIKALSKYTEFEIRTVSVGAVAGSQGGGDTPLPTTPGNAMPPGKDLVNVLDFCAAVCRVAPLTATSANQQPAVALSEKRATLDDLGPAVISEKSVAPFATYGTLVTSLGFILHIIVNGGHIFRRMENVIQCIRLSVIPTAVRTSLSNETDVFRLSMNVLLTCCVTYGPHLVNETSTVFRHVFFRVLESKFTSATYKVMVIEAFRTYIEEPQNLIALFLNYDCNTRSQSIYEEMINYLAALSRIPPRGNKSGTGKGFYADTALSNFADPSDSAVSVTLEYEVPEELRRKAMQTFLLVAESNIQWIERFETDHTDGGERCGEGKDKAAAAGTAAGEVGEGEDPSAAENGEGANDDRDGGTVGWADASVTGPHVVSDPSGDTFLQARRYKDALKKFFYLFNEKENPEAAMEYLRDCILVNEREEKARDEMATDKTRAAPAADETVPTASKQPAAVEEGEAVGGVEPHEDTVVPPSQGPVSEAPPGTATPATEDEASVTAQPPESSEAAAVPAPSAEEVREAARVARFLYDHEDWIDKIVLGDYFAKSFRKTANRLVFEQWINLYDFTGLKLDEALRLFLGGFKLLGEAQIVDRTMELFAAQYCRQNPTEFGSADTAFILSFSICMLNTDAHSAHIKNKMTADGFIRNNKSIDEGNDVDPAILTGIYNRITKDEIVLRPSKYVSRSQNTAGGGGPGGAAGAGPGREGRGRGADKLSGGVLDSIPILRHFAPIATAITDKVLLPMDAMGNGLFGGAQKKREEMYQEELRAALREVTEALRSSAALPHAAYIAATSIQNALPMWEVTVDLLCRRLASSLYFLLDDSESYVSPSLAAQASGPQGLPPDYDPVQAYMRDTRSYEYFQVLLRGLRNTVHVCCSFGNITHSETLLEQAFQMTQLSQTVIMSNTPSLGPQVQVVRVIPRTRLELLVGFLNLYVAYGASFGARGWQVGYSAMSLVDVLANGIEGLWRRQTRRLLARVESGTGPSSAPSPSSPIDNTGGPALYVSNGPSSGTSIATVAASASPSDLWFGAVREVPLSVTGDSRKRRENILNTIRVIPGSAVDLWLERLFDATQFPTPTQLQMANSMVKVCQKELQHSRTFTLTKLFDFVTVCASFSTRLQWRELWGNASAVFVQAGCMEKTIASQALDGLRIIAMTYLMREELLNYSFQKEVLKPFEDILMSNQDIFVRRRVVTIMSELIDFRAGHLASGWHVVFTCLSHAAVIPEVVGLAWEVCERAIALHVDHMKDCFSDLIFCLTTFACTNVDEQVPLRGISYLVACGHWLQYGLEAPPPEVREAANVVRWACRFRNAEVEARASVTFGKNLVRVTQAAEPLTLVNPLVKPGSYVAKTNYHLWMSLFEGLIPILVVHTSTRVRAHAVCSICALLRHYGGVFSVEVQDSLFHSTLLPVLATLLSHVARTGDSVTDKTDYRMLVYLALRSLVLACSACAHLLELCCETLTYLSSELGWSVDVVENDLVDVWVRVCCDMLAAVVTSAGYPKREPQRDPKGSPAEPQTLNNSMTEGTSTPGLNATQNSSFAFFDRSLQSSFNADAMGLVSSSLSWLAAPLPDKKESNPFFLGLLHQVQQMGSVDVVHYKRTAGWAELHISTAVTTGTITLSQPLQTFSLTSLVQRTVLKCLGEGLLARLSEALVVAHRDNRDLCLLFTRAMRHAMLGLSFYCIATRDMEGVLCLVDSVRPFTEDKICPSTVFSSAAKSANANALSGGQASQRDEEVDTPIELLITVPYLTVLLEFIFSFPMDFAETGRRVVMERVTAFLTSMASSRRFCVDQQLEVQHAFQQQAAEQGAHFKPYKGCSFIDIFRCGRGAMEDRGRYYNPSAAPQLRRRKFHEWKYLTSLLAIHCAMSLGTASILVTCADTDQFFQLLNVLPSALEESVANSFLRSCWQELDLHCNMSEESTMQSCLSMLQKRLATPANNGAVM